MVWATTSVVDSAVVWATRSASTAAVDSAVAGDSAAVFGHNLDLAVSAVATAVCDVAMENSICCLVLSHNVICCFVCLCSQSLAEAVPGDARGVAPRDLSCVCIMCILLL